LCIGLRAGEGRGSVAESMVNGVKTKADVARVLEENCVNGAGLMAQVAAEQ
jgi:hypothetical protein